MKTFHGFSLFVALFYLGALTAFIEAGVPLERFEALMKQQSEELGLYNSSDKVVILDNTNFKDVVLLQNRSSLVEFYNSYCGHCKRFAPYYKQLANQLYPWRDVLPVCALDCAAEENNDICREYEVMKYPTLRYFGPDYTPSSHNYGREIETIDLDEIRIQLLQWLSAENRTSNMTAWPNFQNLTEKEAESPFEGLNSQRQYVVLVYGPENTTLAIETALRLLQWPAVEIRRVTDLDLAAKFQIDGVHYKIATVDRKGAVVPYAPVKDTAEAYAETIENVLRSQNFTEKPETQRYLRSTTPKGDLEDKREAILREVKRNKHLVYQADLEMAVRGIIYNEIPKAANISGERMLALQRFLTILDRYNPLSTQGHTFIKKLNEFVMQINEHISGRTFQEEVIRLDSTLKPIFSSNHFVGCASSRPGLRGFTCSVWQLFHFFTVEAARTDLSQDPLEVLQAMHGYVKYFFGCTECSEHFQSMASRQKIWDTPSKEEAVLWLWAAHNTVNQRLAGDATEDPQFPKIQFPSPASCSQCYRHSTSSSANMAINWDKDAVLSFLKNIYKSEYISLYGLDIETILYPRVERVRQKRMIGNVFSEIDIRMGMLLYGFCLVMLVVAFKLFAFKGYRKKPYVHDFLGKV